MPFGVVEITGLAGREGETRELVGDEQVAEVGVTKGEVLDGRQRLLAGRRRDPVAPVDEQRRVLGEPVERVQAEHLVEEHPDPAAGSRISTMCGRKCHCPTRPMNFAPSQRS